MTDALRDAALALVRARFDWSYDKDDDDLDEEFGALLVALGVTADEIAAPGRARSEAIDAERRAKQETGRVAEFARRVALTQDERDAEDRAKYDAMDASEAMLFYARWQQWNPETVWMPWGSKDDRWGSSRILTLEEQRANWCPPYDCRGCGANGKTPCLEGCPTKAENLVAIAKYEAEHP